MGKLFGKPVTTLYLKSSILEYDVRFIIPYGCYGVVNAGHGPTREHSQLGEGSRTDV